MRMTKDDLHGFVTKHCTPEALDKAIKATETSAACLAPRDVPLSARNLINSDTVHEDCRCLYRDCRKPLLNKLDWQRQICPVCWAAGSGYGPDNPTFSPCQACGGKAHDVTTVKLRPLPRQ
jgi:hypothetical protein